MTRNSSDDVVNTSHCVSYFKRSAVDRGYYKDDFIEFFSYPSDQSPLMVSWIYLRVTALRRLVDEFVSTFKDGKVQFVNLGCGLDTMSFYLLQKYQNVSCFDIDFESHLKQKTEFMEKSRTFTHLNYKLADGLVVSDNYKMVPIDFENVEDVYKLETHLSKDLPTVFFSEFCLTYVENEKSDKVIKFFAEFSSRPSAYIFLEYVGSWTPFGIWYSKVFYDFGAEFKSFLKYDTVEKHVKRCKDLGWDHAMVNPLSFAYNELLDHDERVRVRTFKDFKYFDELATYSNHTVVGLAVTYPDQVRKVVELFDSTYYDTSAKNQEAEYMSYEKGFLNEKLNYNAFENALKCFIV